MSENTYLRRHWKALVNAFTIVALAIIVFLLRDEIGSTISNLGKVNAWALVLMLPIEFWNYDAQARMYRSLFKMLGNVISYKKLFEVSLELNFINNVFPSGGVSGVSYFGIRMRSDKDKITGGKATVVQTSKLLLIFLSFEVLLILGLLIMAIGGHASNLVILIATAISTLLVVGTLLFFYIIDSERRINAALALLSRVANRLVRIVRPHGPDAIRMAKVRQTVNELHVNFASIKSNYRQLQGPFIFALIANMTEVLAIYVVYVAFGHWVNIGSVIVAYAVANFAGLISVLPGGIGIYEALMTAVLAAAGIPASLSIPVVIMYRILNTIIQLPPGYYFYHRNLHGKSKPELKNA